MLEKNLEVAGLLDCYAGILSERHRNLLDLYYNQDFSLGEISAEVGISRQGVRDSIKKAEEELFFFENGLHLFERGESVSRAAASLLQAAGNNAALRDAVLTLLDAVGVAATEEE